MRGANVLALALLARALPVADFGFYGFLVATTLILTDLYGIDVCDQLTAIAANLADEEFERFERDGRRAAVAMVLPLGLFFLPAFMLVILVPAGVRFFAVLGQ